MRSLYSQGIITFYSGAPMVNYNPGPAAGTNLPSRPVTFVSTTYVASGVAPSNLTGCSATAPSSCFVNFEDDQHFGNIQNAYNSANESIYSCTPALDGDRERVSDGTTSGCTSGATYTGGGSNRCWVSCVGAGRNWKFTGEIW
jgi:hypothetical protein